MAIFMFIVWEAYSCLCFCMSRMGRTKTDICSRSIVDLAIDYTSIPSLSISSVFISRCALDMLGRERKKERRRKKERKRKKERRR